MSSITFGEVPPFVAKSIDQLNIAELGYRTNGGIPFVKLTSGLTFFGKPVPFVTASGDISDINQLVAGLAERLVNLIANVRLRYYGIGRTMYQHLHYTYKPGDVVLELGAYHGYYSLYIAERIGPSGMLIPVEFVPDSYRVLDLNIRANFPDRATALNVGIDACSGEKRAFVGQDQVAGFQEEVIAHFQGEDYRSVEVRTETVDNIINDHDLDTIDLVIVQLNGHEIAAFEGMQESLSKIRNMAIASRYNPTGTLSKRLRQAGFDVKVEEERWIYASRTGF